MQELNHIMNQVTMQQSVHIYITERSGDVHLP